MLLLKKLSLAVFLTFTVSSIFAVEQKEQVNIQISNDDNVIIPTIDKEISNDQHKCLSRIGKKIEKTKLYKRMNQFVCKHADGVKAVGLLLMQLGISFQNEGPVVFTSQMEAGKGISQYGIVKKLNPKLVLVGLAGLGILIYYVNKFAGYESGFDATFLIAAYFAVINMLNEMAKSKRSIKNQTDVSCMAIEENNEHTYNNNVSRELIAKPNVETEIESIQIQTDLNDAASSASPVSARVTPNITPERARRASISPSFRMLKHSSTQTPNKGGASLQEYAQMPLDEESHILNSFVLDVD